jgi:hypothetical protein
LLRQYNDLDIFVEDVSAQNVYIRLFNRMLNGIAKITQVFPLQSRSTVLSECAKDQLPRNRKRLYIIDGDFELIHGTAAPVLLHLYRLGVYCSENLLLSESAAIEIALECDTSAPWHGLALRLDLRSLFDSVNHLLMPLFIIYAVAEWVEAGVPTSGYAVNRLCVSPHNPRTLSAYKIRRRISEVRAAILAKISMLQYKALRRSFGARLGTDKRQHGSFISGKTYLLPILHAHLKREVGFSGSSDTLKVRLAAYCELNIDLGLSAALHAAVQ